MTISVWGATDQDRDYFAQRAREEERAAAAATSLVARGRHEELALLYWSRAHGAAPARLPVIACAIVRPGEFAL